MRLHLGLLLAHALVGLSTVAAPVPKRPVEPPALTVDLMAGEWGYSWGDWSDGRIYFDRDGSYGAIHVPGSTTWYHGTWSVAGNVLTIVERGFDIETGRTWDGGTYVFDFGNTRVPSLAGTSNGNTPVKLTKPTR